jgi:hypothetical protein
VAIGGTSVGQETSMGNVGNQVIDSLISGDSMCTDYDSCSEYTIAAGQQKWDQSTLDFNWDTSGDANTLVTTPNSGCTPTVDCDGSDGCANREMAVRTDHSSTASNESVYWKIRIPGAQEAGSYTGANTFASTAAETCVGTEY